MREPYKDRVIRIGVLAVLNWVCRMIKIRLTYVDNEKGHKELEQIKKLLGSGATIISTSKEYRGRGNSLYNNIYMDVEINEE